MPVNPTRITGFLPFLSLILPHMGAITAVIIEPLEIKMPEWISRSPNSRINEGVMGARIMTPNIATKTLIKTLTFFLLIQLDSSPFDHFPIFPCISQTSITSLDESGYERIYFYSFTLL